MHPSGLHFARYLGIQVTYLPTEHGAALAIRVTTGIVFMRTIMKLLSFFI